MGEALAIINFISINWLEIWAAVQGFAMIAAAAIAWSQIHLLRRDQKNWETLKACEKYDTDSVLMAALQILRDARNSGDLTNSPKKYSLEMITILNYFEGIIIGIEQRFYNEDIVYDHLKPIIEDHVSEFLSEPCRSAILAGQLDSYSRLTQKLDEWKRVRFKL